MAAIKIKTATKVTPQCYAYITPGVPAHEGWTKIGFTERDVKTRIKEQTHTVGVEAKICWNMRAAYMTEPYDTFTDKDFHAYLKKLGIPREQGTEWFKIEPGDAQGDFINFAQNHGVVSDDDSKAVIPYRLRDEQADAVEKTIEYFKGHENGEFLWNAKPRFGKTLSAYDLCKKIGAKNILIVTNRPAIANSWYQDYETFFGPESGYLFVSNVDGIKDRKFVYSREEYSKKLIDEGPKGCIEFVSLQDLKGAIQFGGKLDKLRELSSLTWDVLIIDEAHEGVDTYKADVAFDHIKRRWTLHLSGTPFKALASDKFPEDAIYNWTYADEQRRKMDWDDSDEIENPYENLPRISLFTYKMSDIVLDRAKRGIDLGDNDVEEYAFDLNEFFKTNESGKFIHDADVDKFLDALTRQEKFPFSTPELRDELKHTFWILHRVSSAKALAAKLKLHPVFKDYEIILAAGNGKLNEDEEGDVDEHELKKSYDKVTNAISNYDKTITLSVGQLTTGVTIPEWTAVLMLSNMSSPALYMQAAFRAQNPCLFTDREGNTYRKKNAYVFDFDPARTLDIFDQMANNLIPETAGDKGDLESRKRNIGELLNFFPVYSEDDEGRMIELDAEKVLTIPRHIHAKEVVERGFMSNFLFANISGIFAAPKEVIEIINNMQAIEEPKKLPQVDVDEETREALHLNDENEVEVPEEEVSRKAQDVFGKKIYAKGEDEIETAAQDIIDSAKDEPNKKRDVKTLRDSFAKPVTDTLMQPAKDEYGKDLKKSTQNRLERDIRKMTDDIVNHEYSDFSIQDTQLVKDRDDAIYEAQKSGADMSDITKINEEYEERREKKYTELVSRIKEKISKDNVLEKAAEKIVDTVETEKSNSGKDSVEGKVRDHLRGFSRTIPAFLMAYGTEETTLGNFDSMVPDDVFLEVTENPMTGKGITTDQFRMLRDGGDYVDEDGETKHFDGHLFDEVVFNDAVKEFLKKRAELANYFDPEQKEDIFDYIPPQRTNQIFTPKRVVVDMVDRLEEENPGCFDDPDATFADLYMKSGMYITEIVKRLFQSSRMKALYPDDAERLNHIFSEQVYGCAPTEIIYRICRNYILGFSDEIRIEKDNIKLCDTLKYAKDGTMEEKMKEVFNIK